jgi:hypothetical protein|tara:strand:- start:2091 stop:2315 length:225 start_codon:yes stop_codon:yes gene_type:complete
METSTPQIVAAKKKDGNMAKGSIKFSLPEVQWMLTYIVENMKGRSDKEIGYEESVSIKSVGNKLRQLEKQLYNT